MALADDLQQRVAAHHSANLEYVRDDYRLSLNPISSRHNEIAFVLWQGTDRAADPLCTGRASNGQLYVEPFPRSDIDLDRVESLIAAILEGEERSQPTVGSPEATLPTLTAEEVEHQ